MFNKTKNKGGEKLKLTKKTNKRSMTILILTMIMLCPFFSCDNTPPDSEPTLPERLQEVLDTKRNLYNGMGVSAAVIIPDLEIWTGVSGTSHENNPITPDTLFGIGSVTKSFTAALIMKLVEDSLLSLEDPLSSWLPPFTNIDSSITIRQLLNQTSGLNCFYNNDEMWDAILSGTVRQWTPEDILSFVPEPYFPPGTGWHYGNTNYILLGMLITEATGSSVSTEFRNRLWEPLELYDTYLATEETIPEPVAHNWEFVDGSLTDLSQSTRLLNEIGVAWTAGAMYSTARDIATWARLLYEGRVLNQASMEQLLTFVPTADFHAPGYGFGVVSYYPEWANGEESIGHTGGFVGYITYMLYLPEHDVAIVVMVNDHNEDCINAIKNSLVQVVMDHLD